VKNNLAVQFVVHEATTNRMITITLNGRPQLRHLM